MKMSRACTACSSSAISALCLSAAAFAPSRQAGLVLELPVSVVNSTEGSPCAPKAVVIAASWGGIAVDGRLAPATHLANLTLDKPAITPSRMQSMYFFRQTIVSVRVKKSSSIRTKGKPDPRRPAIGGPPGCQVVKIAGGRDPGGRPEVARSLVAANLKRCADPVESPFGKNRVSTRARLYAVRLRANLTALPRN